MRPTVRVAASWLMLTLATLLFFADLAPGHSGPRRGGRVSIGHTSPPPPVPISTSAVDTFVLASYTFDGAGAVPDAQGWAIHDLSGQEGTFFHVANATELDGGTFGRLTVLAGSRSLWCGAAPGPPQFCSYQTLPGYGTNWDQRFLSRWFTRTGDLSVSYTARHDSEFGYDRTCVYYRAVDTRYDWVKIRTYEGVGLLSDGFVVPDTFATDSVQIMFRFESDAEWDDADGQYDSDGAFILDDLALTDDTGVIDSQDFEAEAPGATQTADGNWQADAAHARGAFAGIFPGLSVAQEDTSVTNATNLWGFFSGSTTNYACGGLPGQAAVPGPGLDPLIGTSYIHNEIWSPVISLDFDENNASVPPYANTILLEFDVYRDLDFNNMNSYLWHVRTIGGGGCAEPWQDDLWTNFGGDGVWERRVIDITPYTTFTDTDIQVALGVADQCPVWCGTTVDDGCRSHSPLFDNVRVVKVGSVASGAGGIPALTSLAQNVPNPFNPATTIGFTLAAPGSVSLRVYDASGRLVRTLAAGGMSGGVEHRVAWDGRDDAGARVASGVYFYRLIAGGFSETRKMVLLK